MAKKLSVLQKKAIEFEKNGVHMYLEAAEKTENPLARKLFYSLAIEEIEHISFIEERLKADSMTGDEEKIEGKIKAVFHSLEEKEIKEDSDNVEGLEKAMEMERRGKDLYLGLRDEAETEEEKAFFTKLVKEEERHLESLENVYHYLTDADDWYHSTESNTWNWMNQ